MTLVSEKAETEILKTDVLGRVWTPREKREALVAEYERSAMSAAEFAEMERGELCDVRRLGGKSAKGAAVAGIGEQSAGGAGTHEVGGSGV